MTTFADFDSEKCISFIAYVIRLFPTAAIAIISNACSPARFEKYYIINIEQEFRAYELAKKVEIKHWPSPLDLLFALSLQDPSHILKRKPKSFHYFIHVLLFMPYFIFSQGQNHLLGRKPLFSKTSHIHHTSIDVKEKFSFQLIEASPPHFYQRYALHLIDE